MDLAAPLLPPAARRSRRQHPPVSGRAASVQSSAIRDLLSIVGDDRILSLAGGLPSFGALPDRDVLDAVGRMSRDTLANALQYGATEGHVGLRQWVHSSLEASPADGSQVMITAGSQQALSLLAAVLVDPGDVVVVERTSYVGMLQALAPTGAVLRVVGGDSDGIDVDELESALTADPAPVMLYLAPTFQNPSGSVLSSQRRARIGQLASRHRVVVVDDDPYRELGFGAVPERLRCHVEDTLAVTVGSFSKTVAPGLRVGWVHAPNWLHEAMVRLKQATDLHTSSFSQQLLVDLLDRPGWFSARTASLSELYRQRASVLHDALVDELGPAVDPAVVRGGMFAWVDFSEAGVDTQRLLPVALEHGVAFVPGESFDPLGRASGAARLCFATLGDSDLRRAVGRLRAAIESSEVRAGRCRLC